MRKKVILCVDDEKMILDGIKMQLKDNFGNDYLYETAQSAEDALSLLEEFEESGYDVLLIVSDWLMPGIKGDEFLIEVHRKFPRIVNVMLTGHADEKAIQRARTEANLHHCLHKPWSADELKEVIQTGLAKL